MPDSPALHVEPGGPAIEVVDGPVRIRKRSVSVMDNDVYAVVCARTGQGVLIDPADDAPLLVAMIADLDVRAIVISHGHADHTRAWEALVAATGLPVWAHRGDEDLLPATPDRWLEDGDRLTFADIALEVMHVPGHTAGSILLATEGAAATHLFTGDTLFPGGPGNTGGDLARHALVMDGLETRVFARFDDPTRVHPGHGDGTTLGVERPRLAEWRARGW